MTVINCNYRGREGFVAKPLPLASLVRSHGESRREVKLWVVNFSQLGDSHVRDPPLNPDLNLSLPTSTSNPSLCQKLHPSVSNY